MSQVNDRQRNAVRTSSRTSGSRSQSGTSRRQGQSYRSSGSPGRRGKRRKRGPEYNITRVVRILLFAASAIVLVMATSKYLETVKAKEGSAETSATLETELQKEVTVDGISIAGMSREEALAAIEKQYQWGMKVTYQDEEYELKNLLDSKVKSLLEEIYTGEAKESYTLDMTGLEDAVQTEVKAIAAKWDVAPKNGSISGFDKASGSFVYSGEKNGVVIDQDKLAADIQTQLQAKDFTAVVPASANEVAPKITEAQAKEMYKVIGTYSTTTTANKDRNKNIELAADALNGMILQPGETFSFNNATGERSPAKGYRPAGAYLNGVLVEEPGGGVCQVSSTLYNAVVFAGLTTTERHAHSYEPSYVTPGEDAMVSFGGPDMKFVNNSSCAVAIRASFADRKLKISIVGIPILEEGVTLSMSSTKTGELAAPAPVYEEDQTLEDGVEKIEKAETKGSRWVTNLVTKKDGVVVTDEFFHNSTYRGKPATIKRNTSGVVIPATDGSEGASEGIGENPATVTEAPGPGNNETTGAATTAPKETEKPDQETTPVPQGPGEDGGASIIQPNPF